MVLHFPAAIVKCPYVKIFHNEKIKPMKSDRYYNHVKRGLGECTASSLRKIEMTLKEKLSFALILKNKEK